MDASLKPDPIPPAGVWGDPQMLVLESRDADSETRSFAPVLVNASGRWVQLGVEGRNVWVLKDGACQSEANAEQWVGVDWCGMDGGGGL